MCLRVMSTRHYTHMVLKMGGLAWVAICSILFESGKHTIITMLQINSLHILNTHVFQSIVLKAVRRIQLKFTSAFAIVSLSQGDSIANAGLNQDTTQHNGDPPRSTPQNWLLHHAVGVQKVRRKRFSFSLSLFLSLSLFIYYYILISLSLSHSLSRDKNAMLCVQSILHMRV